MFEKWARHYKNREKDEFLCREWSPTITTLQSNFLTNKNI